MHYRAAYDETDLAWSAPYPMDEEEIFDKGDERGALGLSSSSWDPRGPRALPDLEWYCWNALTQSPSPTLLLFSR